MMIDLSNDKLSADNIENCYFKIKKASTNKINTIWLGVQNYEPVFDLQRKIHKDRINNEIQDIILMLEHNHIYTIGKNANLNHILSDKSKVVRSDRGGDVTYHGPGQLVCYPIIDLNEYKKSITWYVNLLQESILSILSIYNIEAMKKNSPYTGVWVKDDKIAAIGIRLSRWISMHGFSVNVSTNLSYYDNIIPCGIFEYGVTSIEEIVDKKIKVFDFASKIADVLSGKLNEKVQC